jgi:hypothetical protein
MRIFLATVFAVLSIAILFAARAPAAPANSRMISVEGPIVEITWESITIKGAERPREWFRLPGSGRVFAADGKTPYPRNALHPGMHVRVFYDWSLTTYVRVADHIIVLTPAAKRAIQ